MTEHGRIGNQSAILKDRSQQQPIIDVADRAIAGVGVSREEQIPLFNAAIVGFFKAMDEASKLTHDHLAFKIRNHREHIVLFANTG